VGGKELVGGKVPNEGEPGKENAYELTELELVSLLANNLDQRSGEAV
jgi:hypothetical protein